MRARNSGIAKRKQPFNDSDLVILAKIVKERGIKGEMKALPLSSKIFFLRPGSEACLFGAATPQNVTVRAIKPMGRHFSISFFGIDSRDSASHWRDSLLKVRRDAIPLEKDEFFCDELIGLSVVTSEGDIIGEVQDIIETGSNDVYVVRAAGREYLIPAIRDVVKEIDRENRKILIEVMEGMLD